jgi:hypothetical protein
MCWPLATVNHWPTTAKFLPPVSVAQTAGTKTFLATDGHRTHREDKNLG